MRVAVLYFAGCPNHKPAVDLARQVAAELDLAVEVEEVEIGSRDDVAALRFLGSPTIQVEGLDVEPAARLRTDYGFSCRMYDGRGLPTRETLAQALAEAANGAEQSAFAAAVTNGVVDKAQARPRTGLWAAGGSVVAAVASSACCWLPLLLAGFGLSAGGSAATVEKFRPLLLGLTAILLGTGFYLSYRRKPGCRAGSACSAPSPGRRVNRAILWMAAIAVVVSAAFPNYVGHLLGGSSRADAGQRAGTLTLVTMPIEGMHCEGCAALVENALRKVPGVKSVAVSYGESQASVSLDRNVLPADDPLVEAVEGMGYRVPGASLGNSGHALESPP